MGRGKTAGDLGEQVPRVPLGIPTNEAVSHQKVQKPDFQSQFSMSKTMPIFRFHRRILM